MKIMIFCSDEKKNLTTILAATSSSDVTKRLLRVSSSNIWSIGYSPNDNKTGKLVVQFKGKNGGPQDIYLYYDVPAKVYRKMITAPSKGHAFWVYIRNRYKYSKLTGDKKTKTPLGV